MAYHGRKTTSAERRNRLTEGERVKRRRLIAAATAASIALFLAFAYLWGAVTQVGIDGIGGLAAWIAAHPLYFARLTADDMLGCACFGAMGFFLPWVAYSLWLRDQGNYDPGAEHGDSRLALAEEFEALMDTELPSNNLKFTSHSGLPVVGRTPELARVKSSVNLNYLLAGTTGGGKTSRVAKPIIAASLGTRLSPGGVGRSGIADAGFDLVFTDTKGDVVPDVGHAVVNSGAELHVFNTRDTSESDRFNPFSQVGCELVDAVRIPGSAVTLRLWADGAEIEGDRAAEDGSEARPLAAVAVDGPSAGASGRAAEEDPLPWICPECYAANPAASALCATPGCPGRHRADAGAVLGAVLKAGSFAAPGTSGVAATARISNPGSAPAHVRAEIAFPFGVSLQSCRSCLSDDEMGELLLTPDGLPVARIEADLEPGGSVAACIVGHAEKDWRITGSMLTRTCSCIVSNLNESDGNSTEDPFWPRCATTLFQGIAGFLLQLWGGGRCTLPAVTDLILSMKVDPAEVKKDAVDMMMDAWETGYTQAKGAGGMFAIAARDRVPCDPRDMSPIEVLDDGYMRPAEGQRWYGPHERAKDTALSAFHTYAKGAPETKQSVLISAASTLSPIMSAEMRELLSDDTLDLDSLGSGDGRHVLAIVSHDQDRTFKPLIALVFYLVILRLGENAALHPGATLPCHVHILADEFANLGKLPEIKEAIATIRSKNVSLGMCVQSFDQLDDIYGEHGSATLRDCCSTMIFMGGHNEKTLKSFETLGGTETVDLWQTSRSYGVNGQTSESRQAVQRPVVSVGQLRTCPADSAYVMMLGMQVFKDRKTGYGAYDYYEWFDPLRADRGCSKGARKFTEPFDFKRYREDREAGRAPYDYDEHLKSQPARWVAEE